MAGLIERTLPRISVNKLGEYMTASPRRRRLIVQDQRRPKGFLVPRYNEALSAIVSFLTSPERDVAIVLKQIERLAGASPTSAWEAQRNSLCAEALQAFLEIVEQFPAEWKLQRGQQRPPLLVYGDVSVSVRPELIVEAVNRRGDATKGAIKLYFSKMAPLSNDAGSFIATAVADFAEQFLVLEGSADPKLCQVVDVFAKTIHVAPRARVGRRREIVAACGEIARAWAAS
jgi:hypothetical protein